MVSPLFATIESGGYKLVLVLHLVAVLIGFAPAVQAVVSPHGPRPDWATPQAIRAVFAPAVIVAGLLGIVLVLLSDEAWEFSQGWVTMAILVWIVAVGVWQSLVLPATRAGGAEGARRALLGAHVLDGLLVLMLYLMVFKPGA